MFFNNKIFNLCKKEVSKTLICVFFTTSILLFVEYDICHSITADELKTQIQEVTATKAELEQEIAGYQQQLNDLGAQKTSLKNTISSLTATINKNTLDIKLTQNNIDSTNLQIQELSLNINKNIDLINSDTEAIASLIKQVNNYDTSSIIENLLTYNNLSDFWNEQENIYSLQNQIKEKIIETKNTKAILESNKTQTEKKKTELLNLKSTLLDKQKLLAITKKEKNKLLADTKNSETNYKKLLSDKQALANAFDSELTQFEAQLKLAVNPASIPSVGKGILSWPLDFIRITQKFGITDFSKTTTAYNGQGHNGVDFAASIGTPVKAALSGVVKGTGNTDIVCPGASFGQWVFIQHSNGLSTIYAHLSLIKVTAGQTVFTGDIIGYSGNTGFTTGPHLHFGVYATEGVEIMSRKSNVCNGTYTMPVATLSAYLDPLQYL